MKEKKYLIYLDILGFKDLAKEIAGKFEDDPIREKFLSEPLKEKIKELEKEGVDWTKGISAITGSDNYVLLLDDDIDKMFKVVGEISTIQIPHEDYSFIPLEVAIDIKEIESGVKVKDPINRDDVIEFLKNDIINPYRKLHKEEHGEQSIIKETFIVLTNAAFSQLKGHHKKECTYKDKEFYSLPLSVIEREKKISDFLKEIRQSKSDFTGALIHKIFVPPDEFDEIKERLKNDRIVFLTGTAGYGKTYTAIKLLWKWYKEGYVPRWVAGKEPEDRKVVRDKLANIEAELEPHHIIYFEDPFGKIIYERRDDLKERINSIINSVKNKDDVYVIITSRKDVFEKFEKESYSVEEIRKFEEELNILKPSYGYEKRREILEKWAEEKECAWLNDEELKKLVFEALKHEESLPTPFSIHEFVVATVKVDDEKELRQEIDKCSKEVEKAFADEIKGLYDSGRKDRVLFLSLIFVSEHTKYSFYFEVDFVKQKYERLKDENFEDFEKILREEQNRVKAAGNILKISHPLYSNALSYILDHPGCRNIFCDVLKELSKFSISEQEMSVSNRVKDEVYFPSIFSKPLELSECEEKLLRNFSEKVKAAEAVVQAVIKNFNKLPEDVRNLLFVLSDKDGVAERVVDIIVENLYEFPENFKNKLLLIPLIEDKWSEFSAWLEDEDEEDIV